MSEDPLKPVILFYCLPSYDLFKGHLQPYLIYPFYKFFKVSLFRFFGSGLKQRILPILRGFVTSKSRKKRKRKSAREKRIPRAWEEDNREMLAKTNPRSKWRRVQTTRAARCEKGNARIGLTDFREIAENATNVQ